MQWYLPFSFSLLLSLLRDVFVKRPTDIREFAAGRTFALISQIYYSNIMHIDLDDDY